jgi:hypothetical protein
MQNETSLDFVDFFIIIKINNSKFKQSSNLVLILKNSNSNDLFLKNIFI